MVKAKQVDQLLEAYSKLEGIEPEADKTTAQRVQEAGAAMEVNAVAFGYKIAESGDNAVQLNKEAPTSSGIIVQAFEEGGEAITEISIASRTSTTVTVSGADEGGIISVIVLPVY